MAQQADVPLTIEGFYVEIDYTVGVLERESGLFFVDEAWYEDEYGSVENFLRNHYGVEELEEYRATGGIRDTRTRLRKNAGVKLVWHLPYSLDAFRQAMAKDHWVLKWIDGEEQADVSYDSMSYDYLEDLAPEWVTVKDPPHLAAIGSFKGDMYTYRDYKWLGAETLCVAVCRGWMSPDCSSERALAEVERRLAP